MTFGKCGLIIGSGTSGKGAYSALKSRGIYARIIDTEFLPDDVTRYDFFVISPGIRHTHPAYAYASLHDIPIYGEIGVGASMNSAPILAVTGTNGKTTTVGMLWSIYETAGIKTAVCGNIGDSFAERASKGDYERVVLELSSFQLLQASPLKVHIGCITNLSQDHLDYHGSMLEYRHAKLKIADGMTKSDYLIIPEKFNLVGMTGNPTIYKMGVDAFCRNGELVAFGQKITSIESLQVRGKHNEQNALCASLMAMLDGISTDIIAKGLSAYELQPHRIAFVGERNGVAFYNDSKGTNIGATLTALSSMQGSTALIMGGSDKGYDYDELFLHLNDVPYVFVCGGNARVVLESARRVGYKNAMYVENLHLAVTNATKSGAKNVLFSPASASFDKYRNYAERGEAFEREVKNLFE